MRPERIWLPAILLFSFASQVAAAKLTITFVGACDFIARKPATNDKRVKVVLPASIDAYAKDVMHHQPFVRFGNVVYAITKPTTIRIRDTDENELPPGDVDRSKFEGQVHKIVGVGIPRPDIASLGVVFALPAGQLIASASKRPFRYAFSSINKGLTGQAVEPLADEVTFVLSLPKAGPIVLLVGDAELHIGFQKGEASVTIGNLPDGDIFFDPAKYTPLPIDYHFLLHYTLAPPYDADKAIVPRQVAGPGPQGAWQQAVSSGDPSTSLTVPIDAPDGVSSFGSRENCFPAWWEY